MSAPLRYREHWLIDEYLGSAFTRQKYSHYFWRRDHSDDGLATSIDDAMREIDARERHRLDALATAQDRADAEERERVCEELGDADSNWDRER
jgi:hypothetical protein